MSRVFAWVFGVIAFLVIILGVTWIVQGNDFFLYKTFAPKYEQVRRETFEESKAYNQGMIQELQNMRREYVVQTDESVKESLRSIILHKVADYDLERPEVPQDLKEFIQELDRLEYGN